MFTINTEAIKAHLAQFDGPPRWRQTTLRLTRTFIHEDRRRCMCIPDRMTAENELAKLKRQHGDTLAEGRITKNGKGKSGTYTVAYTLRETRTENLF